MSSPAARIAIKAQLDAYWSRCPYYDLSDYVAFGEIPGDLGGAMLLLQFIPSIERMATIGNLENHSWEEQGNAIFHLAFPVGENSARALAWGEELVFLFRGKRLGNITIDFIEHFSDFAGAAIKLDGRWHGWSSNLGFRSIVCA